MIRTFEIQGFRSLEQITFQELGQINLFLGDPNSGKRTILDAVYAFSCGELIEPMLFHSVLRGMRSDSAYQFTEQLRTAFHTRNDASLAFSLSAVMTDGSSRRFDHSLHLNDVFQRKDLLSEMESASYPIIHDPNPVADQVFESSRAPLGKWQVTNQDGQDVTQVLQLSHRAPFSSNPTHCRLTDLSFAPDSQEQVKLISCLQREGVIQEMLDEHFGKVFGELEDIQIVSYPDRSQNVRVRVKGQGWLSFDSLGDGMKRIFYLLGGLVAYPNAIHCIKQVDANLHPTAYPFLVKHLLRCTQKYNNQLFLTSHNLEFVDGLLEVAYGSDEQIDEGMMRVITRKRSEKQKRILMRSLSGADAYGCRERYGMELR